MTPPRIAVILVNWNSQADTLACLASLGNCPYPDMKVIVVDNASTDGTADAVARLYPQVELVRSQENLGFTGGNNLGMNMAFQGGAEYVFLLNNDTEITADVPGLLVEYLEAHPEVWAAAPLIYYYSQPQVLWSAGGKIDLGRATSDMMGINEADKGQYGELPYPVDFATGCALMVRRSAVEKFGMLDDRFFMYYEEVEWCCRMKAGGLQVAVVPTARIWHKISPQARGDSPFVHYLMTRNRLLWIRFSRLGVWVFGRVLVENLRTMASWTIRPKWRNKKKQLRAMRQAILDVFRNRYGPPQLSERRNQREILLEGSTK